MTIVFRSSTFFIVFVISFKMTTFVMHDVSMSGENDKMSSSIEQLINESFRKKQEIDDAADGMQTMSDAIDGVENRAVRWLWSAVDSVKRRALRVLRHSVATLNVVTHVCSLPETDTIQKSGIMHCYADPLNHRRTCEVAVSACG